MNIEVSKLYREKCNSSISGSCFEVKHHRGTRPSSLRYLPILFTYIQYFTFVYSFHLDLLPKEDTEHSIDSCLMFNRLHEAIPIGII